MNSPYAEKITKNPKVAIGAPLVATFAFSTAAAALSDKSSTAFDASLGTACLSGSAAFRYLGNDLLKKFPLKTLATSAVLTVTDMAGLLAATMLDSSGVETGFDCAGKGCAEQYQPVEQNENAHAAKVALASALPVLIVGTAYSAITLDQDGRNALAHYSSSMMTSLGRTVGGAYDLASNVRERVSSARMPEFSTPDIQRPLAALTRRPRQEAQSGDV